MDNKIDINKIAGKHLGQQGSYAVKTLHFDPTLLVAIPRSIPREEWKVDPTKFVGFDVWNCHEATFLNSNGIPIAGTLKIMYPSDSECIVESKSLKLFLNTFDMWRTFSTDINLSITEYVKIVTIELQSLLNTKVTCKFFKNPVYSWEVKDPMLTYINIFESIRDYRELKITDYSSKQQHLEIREAEGMFDRKYYIDVLRSRCRITSQKDTGTALVHVITKDGYFTPESILKQIVSLRETNEFHEPCAEKLISDFLAFPEVTGCCITLLYARRGSLDINPVRATSKELLNPFLITDKISQKTLGQ